jgi:hypothetical protein
MRDVSLGKISPLTPWQKRKVHRAGRRESRPKRKRRPTLSTGKGRTKRQEGEVSPSRALPPRFFLRGRSHDTARRPAGCMLRFAVYACRGRPAAPGKRTTLRAISPFFFLPSIPPPAPAHPGCRLVEGCRREGLVSPANRAAPVLLDVPSPGESDARVGCVLCLVVDQQRTRGRWATDTEEKDRRAGVCGLRTCGEFMGDQYGYPEWLHRIAPSGSAAATRTGLDSGALGACAAVLRSAVLALQGGAASAGARGGAVGCDGDARPEFVDRQTCMISSIVVFFSADGALTVDLRSDVWSAENSGAGFFNRQPVCLGSRVVTGWLGENRSYPC